MLEVIGAGNPEYKGQDWGEAWAASPENRQLSEEIDTLNRTRRRKRSKLRSKNDSEFATSLWMQIKTVTKRSFVSYWRSPQYVMVREHLYFKPCWLTFAGQTHAAYNHRPLQHIYVLAPGEQLYRYAVQVVLSLHDIHHCSATGPPTPASIPPLPRSIPVARGQLKDIFMGSFRYQHRFTRTALLDNRRYPLF